MNTNGHALIRKHEYSHALSLMDETERMYLHAHGYSLIRKHECSHALSRIAERNYHHISACYLEYSFIFIYNVLNYCYTMGLCP